MKILYITPQFLPQVGGMSSHVYNIAKRMVCTYHHEISVLTVDFDGQYLPEEIIEGLRIKRLRFRSPVGPRWLWSYSAVPQVLRYLKESNFDIIHVHSYTNFGPLSLYLYSRKSFHSLQARLIFTPHYHPESTTVARNILRKPYDLLFKKRIFHTFSKVIALTTYEKHLISSFCPPDRIEIIPNGIDLDEIEKASPQLFREHYGLNQSDRYVLYAGYLLRYKGVQDLLQAMREALLANPELKLVIIGDGAYRHDLEKLSVNLGIGQEVLFTGFVDRKLLLSALKSCEIFVMPSSYEAFSIITAEAMACEKPVIATKIGGIPELGVADDFLVQCGDVDNLAKLIAFFLNNSEKAKNTGLANYKAAKNKNSWDKIAHSVEHLYRE